MLSFDADQPLSSQLPEAFSPSSSNGALRSNWQHALAGRPLTFKGLLKGMRRNWLVVLSLGLGVSLVSARSFWYFLLRTPSSYRASAALRFELPERGLANPPVSSTSDGGSYQRTLTELLKSRPVLEAALRQPRCAELESIRNNSEATVWNLEKKLGVDWGKSQIVTISLIGNQPAEVAALVNGVKDAYLQEVVEKGNSERRTRLNVLEKMANDLQQDLVKRRTDLQQTATAQPRRLEQDEKQATQRQENYQQELQRIEMQLMKEHLRATVVEKDKTAARSPAVSKSLIEELLEHDAQIQSFDRQLAELREYIWRIEQIAARPQALQEYREATSKRESLVKEKDKRLVELRPEIEKRLRQAADEAQTSTADQAKKDLAILAGEHRQLCDIVTKQMEDVLKLGDDRKKLQGKQEDALQQKRLDIDKVEKQLQKVQEEITAVWDEIKAAPRVTTLQEAREAEQLAAPVSAGHLLAAGLVGMAAFQLLAFGIGWWDWRGGRLHTAEDVAEEAGLPVLGVLPALPKAGNSLSWADLCQQNCYAEAVENLRERVMQPFQHASSTVLLVASALGGEGGTALASVLAFSLAKAGKKTLLIDGDLAHPGIHRLFQTAPEPGLGDLLRNELDISAGVIGSAVTGLRLLAAGRSDAQSIKALSEGGLATLLQRLRPDYDVILIAGSPILPIAHSVSLGKQADAVILPVLRGVSQVTPVHAAYIRLVTQGIRVLGATLLADWASLARHLNDTMPPPAPSNFPSARDQASKLAS